MIYVDFNSVVKKGQLLAEIDRTALQSSVDEAEASLDNARAELTYQESSFNRIKALMEKNLVASADYDLARYNYENSKANLKRRKRQSSKQGQPRRPSVLNIWLIPKHASKRISCPRVCRLLIRPMTKKSGSKPRQQRSGRSSMTASVERTRSTPL